MAQWRCGRYTPASLRRWLRPPQASLDSYFGSATPEKKHLTLKQGWYEVIPEKFLEETECHKQAVQKPKGRQRKGCLYKYLENKKLKNGTIASYPRVIGDRKPDNPTHWRWGFNWEEKIDGEWKGRSIGSVPVGLIPMIQSMQREGASLEEIIGFIKRAKRKVGAPISGVSESASVSELFKRG